jgi:hypothetical protein
VLKEKHIKKFQRLHFHRYGEHLDYDDARMRLALLVRQMEIIYRPITAEQLKALHDEDKARNEDVNEKLSSSK